MALQPLNLVERAAHRLRQAGATDDPAAQLLDRERRGGAAPVEAAARAASAGRAEAAPERLIGAATLQKAAVVDWSGGRTRISEEFRVIQSQLLRQAFTQAAGGQGLANLVMVTSARPGEGKSFAAFNLALSIARQRDHAVLLVDTDAAARSIGRALDLAGAPGLLDLALDPTRDPDRTILRTELDTLSVLPIGSAPERSGELFATRAMTAVIQSLAQRYGDRIVILDAAPCLSSSDPITLAPIVGQIVFVVEAERTQRAEVEAGLDLLDACPNIALLLNKVQVTTNHTFGAYAYRYASP